MVATEVPKTKAMFRIKEFTEPAIPKYLRSTVSMIKALLGLWKAPIEAPWSERIAITHHCGESARIKR